MDEHTPHLSPEVARAQLDGATSPGIEGPRDRWIHGTATIGFGLLWGGWLTFAGRSEDVGPVDMLLLYFTVLVAGAIYLWRQRAGTVPRHTTRAVTVAMVCSLAVDVVLRSLPAPSVGQPWRDLILVALIAAPLVLAGLWIMLRR
jgi:hypothetical protein